MCDSIFDAAKLQKLYLVFESMLRSKKETHIEEALSLARNAGFDSFTAALMLSKMCNDGDLDLADGVIISKRI